MSEIRIIGVSGSTRNATSKGTTLLAEFTKNLFGDFLVVALFGRAEADLVCREVDLQHVVQLVAEGFLLQADQLP